MSCMKWVRFPEFYLTDYFYMNTCSWDAVVFIPKRSVLFFGFGLMANYNGHDMKIKVQWNINDTDSEVYEKECSDGDKDPDKKWFEIDIREFGCKPIRANEGDKIHCKVKVRNDECRRTFYGYNGYKDNYSKM